MIIITSPKIAPLFFFNLFQAAWLYD